MPSNPPIVIHPKAHRSRRGHHAPALILLLALIQGCSTSTQRTITDYSAGGYEDDPEVLLDKALYASSPERDNLYLKAAETIINRSGGQITPHALGLLFEVDRTMLTARNHSVYALRYGSWAMEKGKMELSGNLIDDPSLTKILPQLEVELAVPLHRLRIKYFLRTGHSSKAINEHILLGPLLLDPEDYNANQASLWFLLQQLSEEDKKDISKTGSKELQGWLELLSIATAQELDLNEQVRQLESWLARNTRHPAFQTLPQELRLLQSATRDKPENITLLLPLTGALQQVGEAVRDGFLAAYYQARSRGYSVPSLTIVDTEQHENFMSLYKEVASGPTDLVIGPLKKDSVTALRQLKELPIPTLALNHSAETYQGRKRVTKNLFLFGLNPEDEARQVARRARQNDHYHALLIAPDNSWGQRVANAFTSSWLQAEELEGSDHTQATNNKQALVLASALFDTKEENYSTIVQQILGIEDSKNRANQIKYWSETPVEFEPRRRADVDMIFLAARPEQARRIKPLLAFHYASQVPVYASSSIYSGEPNPEKDNDLHNTQLLISPWLLNGSTLQRDIANILQPSASLQNFYAMGADAWRLHGRLTLLASSKQSKIYGHTGILGMNETQHISRQQLWARIHHGRLKALPGGEY